jgi:hypothetical protein
MKGFDPTVKTDTVEYMATPVTRLWAGSTQLKACGMVVNLREDMLGGDYCDDHCRDPVACLSTKLNKGESQTWRRKR